jgi:hypothetical protein
LIHVGFAVNLVSGSLSGVVTGAAFVPLEVLSQNLTMQQHGAPRQSAKGAVPNL